MSHTSAEFFGWVASKIYVFPPVNIDGDFNWARAKINDFGKKFFTNIKCVYVLIPTKHIN